jgi:hypothetical protein
METLNIKNLSKIINKYPCQYEHGFTSLEIKKLLFKYGIDQEKFYIALGVNTCMVIDGKTITYHCDVEKGIRCVLENRQQNIEEWD